MRLSCWRLGISLFAALLAIPCATLLADSNSLGGDAVYAGGQFTGFNISGDNANLWGGSDDAPNDLSGLQGVAWVGPPLQYDGGGSVGNLIAAYISGGLGWYASGPAILATPASGQFGVYLPVTLSGGAEGFDSQDNPIFDVEFSGVGFASFIGYSYGYGRGFETFSSELTITSGTLTVEWEATPEPPPLLLLASGMAVVAVCGWLMRKHVPGAC